MLANKPKLTAEQLVEHLVSKGVKFTIVSKEEAVDYLAQNNNYFKLTSYRKNFEKYPGGPKAGQYLDLEFAQLKDMAIIDMRLRYLLMHMALDIEHFTKVKMLQILEGVAGEDGYSLVTDFTQSLPPDIQTNLTKEIERNGNNLYSGGIIKKYHGSYPMWAFVEIISFGRLVHFVKFCAGRLGGQQLLKQSRLLWPVKDLRNAVAHNNCILNNLSLGTSKFPTVDLVQMELGAIDEISKHGRKKRMSNAGLQQIVTLLYAHKIIVTSPGVRENRAKELRVFAQRLLRNVDSYKGNEMVAQSFVFLSKVIDNWFPI